MQSKPTTPINPPRRSWSGCERLPMGDHVVAVDTKSGTLKFDGKDAGTLAKGDKVTADARGKLFVDGAAR
jgi:hypothetical protein